MPVGIWRLQIFTGEASSSDKLRLYDCPNDVYILFNPWCEGQTKIADDNRVKDDRFLVVRSPNDGLMAHSSNA